jgi:hypothetical protein
MDTGLIHLHKSLAHLLVFAALLSMILAVAGAGKKAKLANIMAKNHKFGVLMLGRLIYVAGLGTAMMGGHSFFQPWVLAGLLLWAPVEIAAKRLISPELEDVVDGGVGSSRLMMGAALQLVIIVLIYGLMQMRISF